MGQQWERRVHTLPLTGNTEPECGSKVFDAREVSRAATTSSRLLEGSMKTRLFIAMAIISLLALGTGRPVHVGAATSAIVTLDPAFGRIVPDGAQVEKLASGFNFTEGPVWDPAGFLLFTDLFGANRVM